MLTQFKLPDLGEGITEAEIVYWKVKVGDRIEEEQALVEVETDKALVEVPSPKGGFVIELPFKEGDIVKVGETLIVLGDEEDIKEKPRRDVGAVVGVLEEAEERPKKKVLATPAVRKLAKDMGIDITEVVGTGPEDRVTAEDIKRFADEKARGIKRDKDLTYLPFFIKATIAGLKEYPIMNSTLDEEREGLTIKEYYNIGIAVDTKDGLMVPVIKDADKKNIIQLAEDIQRLAEKARSREIDLKDLKGGTFSITNVGALSGTYATPIINYPEAAILGIGRIQDRPWVIDGEIRIRKVVPLSLTFDHRIMDGAVVARFLKTVIRHLEDPGLILIELA